MVFFPMNVCIILKSKALLYRAGSAYRVEERERERKGKRQSSFFRAPYAPFLLYNIFSSRIVLLLLLRRNYKYLSINSLINGFTSAGFSSIGQCPTPFKTVNPAFAYFSYNFLPSSIFSHGSFSPHNINVGVAFSPWLTCGNKSSGNGPPE